MIKLGVNVDHVATLRQARRGAEPDLLVAVGDVILGGADGITIHLREDRRHIQDADVYLLKEKCTLPINLEMATSAEITEIAVGIMPEKACLVPEKREELTTEGGLDVINEFSKIKECVSALSSKRIEVSLFIDPEVKQLEAALKTGAPYVELHTGAYADAKDERVRRAELVRLMRAADDANRLGLKVNAGHGLNYENVIDILPMPHLEELNIGHSIVSRAVFVGMKAAVIEMKEILGKI